MARLLRITNAKNSKKSFEQSQLASRLFLLLHSVVAIPRIFLTDQEGYYVNGSLPRPVFLEYLAGKTSIYLEQFLAQRFLVFPARPRLFMVGPTLLTGLGNATSDNPARRFVCPKAVLWKYFTLLHCRSPHVRAGTYGPANKHAKRVPSNLRLC